MQPVIDFLRQDWQMTREALHQQIAAVESGVLRPLITVDDETEIVLRLATALAQYDALLREYGDQP